MSWREAIKKPVVKPTAPKPKFEKDPDDWDTDLSYQNEVSEKSQRYGSNSVPGTGRIDHVDFKSIQQKVNAANTTGKQLYQEKNPNRGYGGKYGTDKVMDQCAVDFSYQAQVEKHSSQTDFKKGFGGSYGVDEKAKDKSAVGYDYRAPVEKHSSQTDFAKGFGGKFGVDSHAQDKSAVGYSHQESLSKHSSQTDYSVGFGGKYGVQEEQPSKLPTRSSPAPSNNVVEKPLPPLGENGGVGNIRARFENMKKQQDEETAKRVAAERSKRMNSEQAVHRHQVEQEVHHHQAEQAVHQHHTEQLVHHHQVEPIPIKQITPDPISSSLSTPVETVYENIPEQQQPFSNEQKYVGAVNVSSLLRNRKESSSSSNSNNHNDDEWADDYNTNNYQYTSTHQDPVPDQTTSENSSNDHSNEGIRCIARYSYQKTEEDELGFEENEIITHVQKMHEEWWFGKMGARSGLFPANYVEELP